MSDKPTLDTQLEKLIASSGADNSDIKQTIEVNDSVDPIFEESLQPVGEEALEAIAENPTEAIIPDDSAPQIEKSLALATEDAQVEEAQVEEAQVEEAQVEEAQVEEAQVEEAQVEDSKVDNARALASTANPLSTSTNTKAEAVLSTNIVSARDSSSVASAPLYSSSSSSVVSERKNNLGFFAEFLQTLAAIFTDKGVLLMLIIAPIIYGFFYPWPYATEVVNQVPVGIIDYDNSNISKTLVRYSAASPQLDAHIFVNEQAAKQAIWQDQIAGYMLIPAGLENKVKSGQAASVSVIGNGGYFLLNKNIQLGFLKAVGTVSAGIEVKKNVAQGAYLPTAKASTQAIPLSITPLYNQSEGYGAYVVPGVSILILQQTLLMGTALLIGTLYEQRRHHTSARGWLGRISALSLIGFIMGCFYYGWVFDIHHYARGQNLLGSLLFLALFFPAVAALGCFLGLWFKERERGMQILIVSSLPLFFISGYPWPVDQLPIALQYLRWLIPTSTGINTSVQLNQMGASLNQVWPNLMVLVALFVFYYLALLALESSRRLRKLP